MNITDSEVKLFRDIINFLIKQIEDKNSTKSHESYQQLLYSQWEIVPLERRKIILRNIEVISKDNNTIAKYFHTYEKDEVEKKFGRLKTKILHPDYYRLMNSILKLVDLCNYSYYDLAEKIGEEKIFCLEKDMNNLLNRYSYLTDGFISGYPTNKKEIILEDKVIEYKTVLEKDRIKQIEDALKEKDMAQK